MLRNFQTYQLSLQFYKLCVATRMPRHLKDQLLRASSSFSLNLAEGSAKPTKKDQLRYYYISYGSLCECQTILNLVENSPSETFALADRLGACLFKLTRSPN